MKKFSNVVRAITPVLNWVTYFALVAMMLLGTANVVLRIFDSPILGTVDIISLLGAAVIFFAWAHTEEERAHISIDLIVARLPVRAQAIIDSITGLLSIVICFLLTWQTWVYGMGLLASGEKTATLQLPFYPLVLGCSVCCGILGLVFLLEFLNSLGEASRK